MSHPEAVPEAGETWFVAYAHAESRVLHMKYIKRITPLTVTLCDPKYLTEVTYRRADVTFIEKV